jgi:cytochrome P450
MPWVRALTRKLGVPVVPDFVDKANVFLEDWNADMCRNAEKHLSQTDHQAAEFAGNEPVVYRQFRAGLLKLRATDATGGKAAPNDIILPTSRHDEFHENKNDTTTAEIYSDMLDQLGAGHETSAVALTYLYWEMSQRPELQQKLREEALTLAPPIEWPQPHDADTKDFKLPDPKDVDALPLLDAIVMETLRVHTPIPGIEPRVSPHVPGGSTLGKYSNIPGGVRVSSMPYTLHRNEDVFPSPNTWNPSRWLPSHTSEEHLKEMHRWFWAFGSGGRMCIGSHLATQEIKLLVASIYSNWTTEVADDEGIEEVDAYTTRPTSNRLMLRFKHV